MGGAARSPHAPYHTDQHEAASDSFAVLLALSYRSDAPIRSTLQLVLSRVISCRIAGQCEVSQRRAEPEES